MNLHATVRGVVTSINPDSRISIWRSTGYETLPNHKQVPAFSRRDLTRSLVATVRP